MKALMVFTSKTVDEIIKLGGTGHWNLTPARVAEMPFAVCVFCDTPDPAKNRTIVGRTNRGSAYLVGKVSGLRRSKFENGRQRYVVEFSDYAVLEVDDVWDGSRNPVRYVDMDYLQAKGIDFNALDFRPMPDPEGVEETSATMVSNSAKPAASLTIAQAKAGLASQFGVSEEHIQIVISA